MANECIFEEYGPQAYKSSGQLSGSAIPKLITTQTKDIGTLSNALNGATAYVVVQAKGTAFWVKPGASDASAAANTAGNLYVPANGSKEIVIVDEYGNKLYTHLDTAADA